MFKDIIRGFIKGKVLDFVCFGVIILVLSIIVGLIFPKVVALILMAVASFALIGYIEIIIDVKPAKKSHRKISDRKIKTERKAYCTSDEFEPIYET